MREACQNCKTFIFADVFSAHACIGSAHHPLSQPALRRVSSLLVNALSTLLYLHDRLRRHCPLLLLPRFRRHRRALRAVAVTAAVAVDGTTRIVNVGRENRVLACGDGCA